MFNKQINLKQEWQCKHITTFPGSQTHILLGTNTNSYLKINETNLKLREELPNGLYLMEIN